jgi:hypothetical protein
MGVTYTTAAANTYVPIATTTLASTASGVTFSTLGSYTDLVIVVTGYNTTSPSDAPIIRFNGDTATNYSDTELYGNGTTAGSGRMSNNTYITTQRSGGFSNVSTQPGMVIINVMNYGNSTTYKTVLVRSGIASATYPSTEAIVGMWRNTAAITSVSVTFASTLFAIGSTFSLYGIKGA